MAIILDKTKDKNKSADNRRRFINRNKQAIKEQVDKAIAGKSIKDINSNKEISISKKSIREPSIDHDDNTGIWEDVRPGNRKFNKGYKVPKPKNGQGDGGSVGSPDGKGEDDFVFILNKDEFLDILFEDLELPNFVKDSLRKTKQFKREQAGFTKYGIPARLHIRKTFEAAIGRRIGAKASGRKPRYLDDVDLRYKQFVLREKPSKHAVMFCIMDTSGSMFEHHKDLAKRFFILLYLFLTKNYDNVDVRFISHTIDAKECSEDEFFNNRESGGTIISSALGLVNEIIDKEYDLSNTNIYAAQVSDGGNWPGDVLRSEEEYVKLLSKLQYMAYLEVHGPSDYFALMQYAGDLDDSFELLLKLLAAKFPNFQFDKAFKRQDIFPVLARLFPKSGKK